MSPEINMSSSMVSQFVGNNHTQLALVMIAPQKIYQITVENHVFRGEKLDCKGVDLSVELTRTFLAFA